MNIIVSNSDPRPIYEQVSSQIKDAIARGELMPGQALPSIRQLAKDLRISVITTKRAYEELERDGFLDAVAGKGCFVSSGNSALAREAYMRQIEEHLNEIKRLARPLGLDGDGLISLMRDMMKEDEI